MVKVTVDIRDKYWLAKSLTAIEILATEDDTNIDDVAGLVHTAKDAAAKCNPCIQCNPYIPLMEGEMAFDDIIESIQALRDKVNELKSSL
ncbi:MAG: hypothetical protein F6K40_12325 [Okeania sp. SIO3I5]|uniref:hypothetical protein n=1 Tax=Okeania sp. SIO3I5 TaxID=2607805 RepID=UPI0013B98C16|nr:hypothetical protein [Okeania sp. SIO3I5]NEQ37016.1 hypothetical protein [Okeania sp. SIO3I5]